MNSPRFDRYVVREVLKQLAPTFFTKDLSEHPRMLAAHAELASHSHYHSFAGKYLSTQCSDVEPLDGESKKRGARWRNLLASAEPSISEDAPETSFDAAASGAEPTSLDLGTQSSTDNAFTARMRHHMSWYRASVLRVPCGTGPTATSTKEYGNMLTKADAKRGLNFLTPEIHQVALARLNQGNGVIEPYRLLHNMLSSQPMCFNLFGPLVNDRALATTLQQTIPELRVARVLDVKLEHAPASRDEYLGDNTAFDAFIDYERVDGSRAFLGIETKLTDKFSDKHYDSPHYRRWMRGERSPFGPEAESQVALVVHNQLWRDHLLAIAMRDHARSPYQHGTLVLVRHPADLACAPIVKAYQRLLVPGDATFIDLPLDRLLERWQSAALTEPRIAWLRAFRERYLSLDQSEAAR
jgi:hypothetical protein